MSKRKIAVIVGSLRKGSFNRLAAKALIAAAPPGLEFAFVEIGQLPFYNEDIESAAPPQAWLDFRAQVKDADALLFVTPEYNRSVPAALKNAVDVGSRPHGHNVWGGKPGAVVSVSPGAIGGFGANHHLRQSLAALNVPVMAHPEAYIGGAAKLFDDKGNLVNEGTQKFFASFMAAFAVWVRTHTAK